MLRRLFYSLVLMVGLVGISFAAEITIALEKTMPFGGGVGIKASGDFKLDAGQDIGGVKIETGVYDKDGKFKKTGLQNGAAAYNKIKGTWEFNFPGTFPAGTVVVQATLQSPGNIGPKFTPIDTKTNASKGITIK